MLRLTTKQLQDALRAKFGPPGYAIVFEVREQSKAGACRTADAVAIGLWQSTGTDLQGFEIKADRSDWLRELKAPEKSDPVGRFCDRWWVVAPDGVVKDDELPENWGLLVHDGKTLKARKKAPPLAAQLLTRDFLAALMRRSAEQTVDAIKLREQFEAGRAAGQSEAESLHRHEREMFEELSERVDAFEKASGIRMGRWSDGQQIGDAVRAVMSKDTPWSRLRECLTWLDGVKQSGETVLAQLEAEFKVNGSADSNAPGV